MITTADLVARVQMVEIPAGFYRMIVYALISYVRYALYTTYVSSTMVDVFKTPTKKVESVYVTLTLS
jgi:hypothetical protein